MATKCIQLYCPSLDETIENFTFLLSASDQQNLEHLRAAFGTLKSAWPWDTAGHQIDGFADIEDGQRILVAGDFFEAIEAESPFRIIEYHPTDTAPLGAQPHSEA
ncbi:hypothetical protein P280DRAFT_468130 [Massarina eburnea CBS 473.64]|uniref:Uncharacterized protein n=1 Tax=Massarina eburnea CBS 473.64 TaxID=1395130 RepID=A0A6A6S4I8_9PLEO|nr:hypothetical protein P280DRAFT_468130 [Massarina eburnea CBS 473.64]